MVCLISWFLAASSCVDSVFLIRGSTALVAVLDVLTLQPVGVLLPAPISRVPTRIVAGQRPPLKLLSLKLPGTQSDASIGGFICRKAAGSSRIGLKLVSADPRKFWRSVNGNSGPRTHSCKSAYQCVQSVNQFFAGKFSKVRAIINGQLSLVVALILCRLHKWQHADWSTSLYLVRRLQSRVCSECGGVTHLPGLPHWLYTEIFVNLHWLQLLERIIN